MNNIAFDKFSIDWNSAPAADVVLTEGNAQTKSVIVGCSSGCGMRKGHRRETCISTRGKYGAMKEAVTRHQAAFGE